MFSFRFTYKVNQEYKWLLEWLSVSFTGRRQNYPLTDVIPLVEIYIYNQEYECGNRYWAFSHLRWNLHTMRISQSDSDIKDMIETGEHSPSNTWIYWRKL